MTSILQVNPIELVGLKQAAYVSQCLANVQNKEGITAALGHDRQLVNMWILFLKHNSWIEESCNGRWSLMPRGLEWAEKVGIDGNN